jgi:hypothetical protein
MDGVFRGFRLNDGNMESLIKKGHKMKFKKLFSAIKYCLPDWEQRIDAAHFEFRKWWRATMDQFFSLIALFLAVWVGHAAILALVKYSWYLLRETQVGISFLANRPASTYLDIIGELNQDIIILAFRLNRDALMSCIVIGIVAQFSCVRRYFYDGHGILNHMVWLLLSVFITASDRFELSSYLDTNMAFFLYFFPVCCLLDACMKLSAKFLPEAGIVFKAKY